MKSSCSNDDLSNKKTKELIQKLKERNYEYKSINLSLNKYFNNNDLNVIKQAMYNLNIGNSPFVYSPTDRLQREGVTLEDYWKDFYKLIYCTKNFPYGRDTADYERHKKKMMRRYIDLKEKTLFPPNFKSDKSFGLEEMNQYIDYSSFDIPKPKVKGKTLIIPIAPGLTDYKLEDLMIYTYINKFENVEIPASYLLKHDYQSDSSRYKFGSIYSLLYDLKRGGMNSFKKVTSYLEEYQVLCFNLFLAPMRDKHIEDFMGFLIAFQIGHPKVYIKDISGRGYNVYRKFSFYQKLIDSRIDIKVM